MSNKKEKEQDNLKDLENLQAADAQTRTVEVTIKKTVKELDGETSLMSNTEKVFIRPLVFPQWLTALQHFKTIIAALPDGNFDLNDPAMFAIYVLQILAEAKNEVLEIVSMAINRPPSFFDDVELDEAINLIKTVFEVNKDFFTRKLLPMINSFAPGITDKLTEAVNTIGQTE